MLEGWRETRLGDLFEPSNTRLGEHAAEPPVFSVSKYDGVIPAEDFFGKRVASADLSTYKLLPADGWVYSTIHIDEGSIARNNLDVDGVVSPMYTVMNWTSAVDDPRYVEHLLRSREMLATYADNAQGSINRRRSLSWKSFSQIEVQLPPLAEQRRIVGLIAAVDDAIEAAEDEAVRCTIVLDDLGVMAESKRADGSWESVPLSEVLGSGTISTGPFGSALHQHDYKMSGTAVVMPKNISDRRVQFDGIARIGDEDSERLSRYRLLPGDIVWSRRGDVTRFAVIQGDDEPAICGTGCFIVRAEDPGLSSWLEVWMSSPYIKRWLTDRAVGATMANLNTSLLGSAPVALPPETERTPLVGLASACSASRVSARATTEALRTVRSNLLTVLLSGEHEIPSGYDQFLNLYEEAAA